MTLSCCHAFDERNGSLRGASFMQSPATDSASQYCCFASVSWRRAEKRLVTAGGQRVRESLSESARCIDALKKRRVLKKRGRVLKKRGRVFRRGCSAGGGGFSKGGGSLRTLWTFLRKLTPLPLTLEEILLMQDIQTLFSGLFLPMLQNQKRDTNLRT